MIQTLDPISPHSLVQPQFSPQQILIFFPYITTKNIFNHQNTVTYISLYLLRAQACVAMEPNTMASFDDEVNEEKQNKIETWFMGFVRYQVLSFGFALKFQSNVTFGECSIVIHPSRLRSAKSVAMKLKTATMDRLLWRAMCALTRFANLAMNMSAATVLNVVLNATLFTNATKVKLN